jgi:hypothetical protein
MSIKTYEVSTDEPDLTPQAIAAAPELLRAARQAQLVLLGFPACGVVDRWETVKILQRAIDKATLGEQL